MVGTESWRDFIAEAPNYELEIYSGVPFYLDMQKLMLQGAVSFDGLSPIPDTSAEDGSDPLLYTIDELALRGWQYRPLTIMNPMNGFVEDTRDKRGWIITSEQGFVGEDCFNYFLTNGFQASGYGKVSINVLPWYEIEVQIDYDPDLDQYKFVSNLVVPDGADVPVFQRWRWEYLGPNDDDGDGLLNRDIYETFKSTYYRTHWSGWITIYSDGTDTGWITIPTDVPAHGIKDPMTGLPYEALNKFQEIVVTVELFLDGAGSKPDFGGRKYTLTKTLSELLNVNHWADSGLIANTDVPTVSGSLGNVVPPYVTESTEPNTTVDDPYVPDVDSPA